MVDDHPLIIEGYRSILSLNTFNYTINVSVAYNCEDAYNAIIDSNNKLDVIFIDINLPEYIEKNIKSGEDLVALTRKHKSTTKVVILTSHEEVFFINNVLENCKPDALLLKNDINVDEFLEAFTAILNNKKYYSKTVRNFQTDFKLGDKLLDTFNTQIIIMLSQGIKNKRIQELLYLSKSAIDKRKVIIKTVLGIDKGTDEDIVREAKKRGLI